MRRSLRRGLGALLAVAGAAVALPRALEAHPLHSTITEIVEDRARGTVRATIRVFADDFGVAVRRAARGRVTPSAGAAWDSAVLAYANLAFGLLEANGKPLALRSCGIRRTGDLIWLCLEAPTSQPLASLRVRDAVLCDLFDDQVNVVQGTIAGQRRSLLFVRGDRAKPLR